MPPSENPEPPFESPRAGRAGVEIPTRHDPYAAFRFRDYRFYFIGNFISVVGRQMLSMAVGYEVYQRTHSATALGLIGLASALPVILLVLPAGQLADRLDRKRILLFTQVIVVFTSIALTLLALNRVSFDDNALLRSMSSGLRWTAALFGEKTGVSFGAEVPLFFALLLLNGTARAFHWAARSPFTANLVPREALGNAVTWGTSNFEVGSMVGPAIGGLLIWKLGFAWVYALDAVCQIVFIALLLPIRTQQVRHKSPGHPWRDLLVGLRFITERKVLVATMTLDLFAVLLGGAVALLPIFAVEILGVDSFGLGLLRAAPSVGAVSMALFIAHRPPMKRAGITLLWAVAGFGAATIVFGLSRSFWLSMAMLAITGALDNISVVVRHTLVQLLTPDTMRGRVAAVNNVFIGSSNELGAFESGITAALFGPVISVVAGGVGTILVVLGVAAKWPQVRKIGALHPPEG